MDLEKRTSRGATVAGGFFFEVLGTCTHYGFVPVTTHVVEPVRDMGVGLTYLENAVLHAPAILRSYSARVLHTALPEFEDL